MQYDDKCLYVAITDTGRPFILIGCISGDTQFRWHILADAYPGELGTAAGVKTGQEALHVFDKFPFPPHIYAFSDPMEGLTFFYDAYKKFYSKVSP